ncbi:MAG: hypothetical protein IPQ16_00785 [Geobacteraceae bacterium]|nr:hypothetical protein [Geobacteraceae bacterium]
MFKVVLVMTVSVLAMSGCKAKPGIGEPGYNLVNSKCGTCHFAGVKKAHATKEEWDKTVTRMMGKGVTLNDTEKATVIDFLVKYYHP